MEGYRHRILDSLLERKLQAKGAVLIEGPKWCGKTTTAEEIAASKVLLARKDVKEQFKSLLEIDMDEALRGETPMLIDEWQTVPKLWDAVRYTVDERRRMGQFILTGSAVPDRGGRGEGAFRNRSFRLAHDAPYDPIRIWGVKWLCKTVRLVHISC